LARTWSIHNQLLSLAQSDQIEASKNGELQQSAVRPLRDNAGYRSRALTVVKRLTWS
jgi:hypothetical protein